MDQERGLGDRQALTGRWLCVAILIGIATTCPGLIADTPGPAPPPGAVSDTTGPPVPENTATPTLPDGKRPLHLGEEDARDARAGESYSNLSTGKQLLGTLFVAGLLLGGLILVLWAMKKWLPGSAGLFSHPAVRVLGRTYLAPQIGIYLVQVGDRVLALGVSRDRIQSLCQLQDPNEVARLVAQTPATRRKEFNFAKKLERMLGREEPDSEAALLRMAAAGPDAPANPEDTLEQVNHEVEQLRNWIRSVRDTSGPIGEAAP